MTLPVLEKTWYHNTNWMFLIDTGNEDTGARNLFLAWHYFIQDVVLSDWAGAFTIPVAGTVRYTLSAVVDIQFDGPWTQFRAGKFIAADVGRKIDIKGAPAAGNNGYFTITAVDPSGLWCEYLNGSGVAQTHTGHARVLRGSWPSLPNGRGPLRVYQCNSATAGKTGGTAGDRLDRYQTLTDFSSNAGAGNRSTVIYENEISGSQFAMYMDYSSGGQYRSGRIYLAPNGGLVMPVSISSGLTVTHPGGINNAAVLWWPNTNQWWGQASLSFLNRECFMNMQFTSDGLEYNMFCMNEGAPAFAFHGRRPADVPTQVIPWSGTRDIMLWQTYNAQGSGIRFPYYNTLYYDWIGTAHLDHLGASTQPSGPGPHYCPLVGSAEYLSTDQNQQWNPLLKNETLGEYNFYPIGLFSYSHLQIKGKVGRLPDWFYSNLSTAMPLRMGCTYPEGGGRLWIKLYNTVLPWNGSRLKLITGD